MGPKTKSGIHWTNLELRGLLEDEDSCVYLERAKKHLGLHPIHLNDLNGSLREIISEKLNFYDPELNGLVLAYRNPKVLSPYGEILYDTCYIHIDIEADFYVFRPKVGRSLKGYVNKKSTNHIGILVHKAFNASIPRPQNDELNDEDWPGHRVRVGQEIRFTPEEIDFKSRLPYIRGSLKKGEYLNGCKLFNEQIAASYESEFQEIARQSINLNGSDETIVKRENKRLVFNSDSEVDVDPDSTDSPSKKKKRKSTPARELGTDNEIGKSDCEDSTDRPKKRKHNAITNNTSPTETDDERAQKSKIRKLSPPEVSGHSSETESTAINSPKKKHKKKTKNYLDFDTEDERNHKAEIRNITNSLADESTLPVDDVFVTKRSNKKKTRDTDCVDTEDELRYKSTIDKSFTPTVADEHGTSKSKRKRKRSILDEIPEDTEDERNYKSSLKEYIDTNNLVPEEPPKKKKKKRSHSEVCEDTEGETRYETSLNDSEFRVPETPKKKKNKVTVRDDTLMDTEDERQHKSYLKGLVEAMETNGTEVSDDHVKTKKEKKLRKNSVNYELDETNGLSTAVVKCEDEQETTKKLKKKDKRIRREESGSEEM